MWFCLVAFSAFLRCDEICNIRWCDVVIEDQYFFLYILKSKTDQYHEGCNRLVAKTAKLTCPHIMLFRYTQLAKKDTSSKEFVFTALGFSRVREVLLAKLKAIGLETSRFGLHSLPDQVFAFSSK